MGSPADPHGSRPYNPAGPAMTKRKAHDSARAHPWRQFFSMKASLMILALFLPFLGCGGGGGGGSSSSSPPTVYSNQIDVQLLSGQLNIPTVSVTLCVPGTSDCQTINNILIDTGSVGLRIAHNLVTIPLPAVTDGASDVYECYTFATSDNFGPVVSADVSLGGEPTVTVDVQISNHTLTSPSSTCTPSSIQSSGINGILGVGYPFSQDDGGDYYACPSSGCTSGTGKLSCSGTIINPASPCHVANPVFSFPSDNNGVLLALKSISTNGAASPVYGVLTFGIGTQSDNSLSGLTTYTVSSTNSCGSSNSYIDASFTGGSTGSCGFLDSGSNGFFFGTTTFPLCGKNNTWYCPSPSPATISLTLTGGSGATGSFSLNVLSENTIVSSNNIAWNDLAGPYGSTTTFDAGLPFFFGRTVAVGYNTGGQTAFWAF